jgi:hypothetical protein
MYDPLLERIVEASENTNITQRAKALRAIGMVVAQDPELFHQVRLAFPRPSPILLICFTRLTGELSSCHRGSYARRLSVRP